MTRRRSKRETRVPVGPGMVREKILFKIQEKIRKSHCESGNLGILSKVRKN